MGRFLASVLGLGVLAGCGGSPSPAVVGMFSKAEVRGVEEGDMLKLRAGPGIGYDVVVGLPNGAVMRMGECSRIGKARWCEVALDAAPGLKGYVSETYLRKL